MGPDIRKMAFGRNGMGPCGKRAKWLLGENEIGRKGRTDIGRNGKRMKLERAKKELVKREKFGQNGNGRNGIWLTGNKPSD